MLFINLSIIFVFGLVITVIVMKGIMQAREFDQLNRSLNDEIVRNRFLNQ